MNRERRKFLGRSAGAALAVGPLLAGEGGGIVWEKLAPLPDREGFASMFAGVVGGKLVAAGGASFPDKKPWEGGTKVWHDRVFVLDAPDKTWKVAGKLPRPLAYGIAVSTSAGLLCIGGSDASSHFADCFEITIASERLSIKKYPSLPKPCANMTGLRMGDRVYVLGGTQSPDSAEAMRTLWMLDLGNLKQGWQELSPWPGPARMLAVCAQAGGRLFLFGGADLSKGSDGKVVRTYLKDAFEYSQKDGWRKLANMPRAAVAAPSPAWSVNNQICLGSGDDGALVNFEPKSRHPGFSKNSICLDLDNGGWKDGPAVPFSLATVPVVQWQGRVVVVSGEARPGVRTPEIWSGRLP